MRAFSAMTVAVLLSLAQAILAQAPPALTLNGDYPRVHDPSIVRHGHYYLFVSFDLCCRGAHSTYRIMVGRSRKVTGPYVDDRGTPMLQGGGKQLLTGNSRWVGPGGESVLPQPVGDLLVFHAYDAQTGKPALQISTLKWEHGWPQATVAATGESKE